MKAVSNVFINLFNSFPNLMWKHYYYFLFCVSK